MSGSNDCKIRVWNAWTGECLRTLAGHNALVRAISFDSKTGRLLSASYDKVVKVWDLYNGTFDSSLIHKSVSNLLLVHIGKLIREFKHTHTSHIFDVKFDLGRIVRCVFSLSFIVFLCITVKLVHLMIGGFVCLILRLV